MESTITSQIATNSSKAILSNPFLQLDYWFGTPLATSLNHWPTAVLAAIGTLMLIAFAVTIALKALKKELTPPQQKFLTKLALIPLVFGFLAWIFTLARMFGVVFFGARFWWVIWLLLLAVSFFWIYRNYKKLPIQQIQFQTYQLKKRYFPKKKKRH